MNDNENRPAKSEVQLLKICLAHVLFGNTCASINGYPTRKHRYVTLDMHYDKTPGIIREYTMSVLRFSTLLELELSYVICKPNLRIRWMQRIILKLHTSKDWTEKDTWYKSPCGKDFYSTLGYDANGTCTLMPG